MFAIICDKCDIAMKWFDCEIEPCGCCGTDYYKCPQCGAVKTKIIEVVK